MEQIHKRFTTEQVKEMITRYLHHKIERKYIQSMLGIGKTRFFELVQDYRENLNKFSIGYSRASSDHHRVDAKIEKNILKELSIDKLAIENKDTPLKRYNYSYVKEQLETKYGQKVSLPTVIDRAKKHNFYFKARKHKIHDREVLTRYAGELIQHDASYHLWAPAAGEKWYLITSLDDFSRYILYAALLKRESIWAHILALQTIALKHGLPYSFYVDSHAIFRFVRGRDEFHYKHHLMTDDTDTQWKQVLNDCGIKVIYALSPQAKGKIERPYGWLQDHLVRTCIRENVTDLQTARTLLGQEVHAYNHKKVHSTTREIPYLRFQRAIKEKQTLFREFKIRPPFKSVKDIFCFRIERVVDAYRKISLNNLEFKVGGVNPYERIELRIYPVNHLVSEIRFWHANGLVDIQTIKNTELNKRFAFEF